METLLSRDTRQAMLETNLEIVGRLFSQFEKGNFWVPEFFDPNVRVVWLDGVGVEAETTGLQAMSDLMMSWLEPHDRLTLTAERLIDAGDQVVASAAWRGRGRISGVATEWRFGLVFTLRDGRITSMVAYRELDDALKAVGLSD
jgi:ketosteroid isomerase-like protein